MSDGRVVGTHDSRGKDRVQTVNDDPSETVQSDAHLADIQNIMARFGQEGRAMLDEADLNFLDVTEFTDLADALRQSNEAQEAFMKLPRKVREIFDHDVAVWLDTAHDQEKRDALVEAGFLKPKDIPSPGPAEGSGVAASSPPPSEQTARAVEPAQGAE